MTELDPKIFHDDDARGSCVLALRAAGRSSAAVPVRSRIKSDRKAKLFLRVGLYSTIFFVWL